MIVSGYGGYGVSAFPSFNPLYRMLLDQGVASVQTVTQHSGLARAVVARVGIYDMLRVELSPNGEFNVPEFGTVKDREQFQVLHAYSPYHLVRDGTAYPAILFMTGANDPRVDPMQSRKMTARLQASGTSRPVLLRTSGKHGPRQRHSIGCTDPAGRRHLQLSLSRAGGDLPGRSQLGVR